MDYRYNYYSCRRKRVTSDKRTRGLTCPKAKAGWLAELVWADVRSFLENPGEVLQRAREQFAGGDGGGEDLEERHAALTRRLAAKRGEKDRYVKLYAQGLVDDEELEVHLADLRYQVENLKMLIASVEDDLTAKDEEALVAEHRGLAPHAAGEPPRRGAGYRGSLRVPPPAGEAAGEAGLGEPRRGRTAEGRDHLPVRAARWGIPASSGFQCGWCTVL
jgi:hypothetical protein